MEQIEAQISASEPVLRSLKHLRDTRLAHHDSIVSVNLPLQYEAMLQLIDDIKTMYNLLRRGHDRNIISYNRIADDAEKHTMEIVTIMREEMERTSQRWREKLSAFEGN